MKYFDELKRAMAWAAQKPRTFFLGQAVGVPGTFMFNTLTGVPAHKRLELPVCESLQMQLSVGLAFAGYVPISVFPRLNFLLLAMGDLTSIVDKLPELSPTGYPKLVIRSAVGPDEPVHPGHQHVGDFTETFRTSLRNVDVIRLEEPTDVLPAYQAALDDANPRSSLIIEVGNYYNRK